MTNNIHCWYNPSNNTHDDKWNLTISTHQVYAECSKMAHHSFIDKHNHERPSQVFT